MNIDLSEWYCNTLPQSLDSIIIIIISAYLHKLVTHIRQSQYQSTRESDATRINRPTLSPHPRMSPQLIIMECRPSYSVSDIIPLRVALTAYHNWNLLITSGNVSTTAATGITIPMVIASGINSWGMAKPKCMDKWAKRDNSVYFSLRLGALCGHPAKGVSRNWIAGQKVHNLQQLEWRAMWLDGRYGSSLSPRLSVISSHCLWCRRGWLPGNMHLAE